MKDLKTLKIGLLGSGTVGTGVYKLVESQKEEMPHKIGANLSVAKILVRDKTKRGTESTRACSQTVLKIS